MPAVNWLDTQVISSIAVSVRQALAPAPGWLTSLLVDGLIAGAGAVLSLLPVLLIFFAVLGVLEDVGYLARSAYVMDRFMHWMGLHGRSFLPLFIGFGCNVPGVLGARIIEERRARLLTILLTPLVPCTGRMAVIVFLAPAFFGKNAAMVTWGLVAGNILLLFLIGLAVNRGMFKGARLAFIMEMPLYHLPNIRTIGLYVWHNTWAFIKKAGTIILLASAIVWLLAYLPNGDVQGSLLASLGRWLEPVGRWFGLGDWRLIVALLSSFVAKENVIATLGVLFGNGANLGLAEHVAGILTPAAGLAFLVVQMTFIPCAATMAAIKQETGSWKWPAFSVGLLLVISFGAAVIVYQFARVLGNGG
jgi:ferrous iron transport protein B